MHTSHTLFALAAAATVFAACSQTPVKAPDNRPDSDQISAMLQSTFNDQVLPTLKEHAKDTGGQLAVTVLKIENKSNTKLGTEIDYFQRKADTELDNATNADNQRLFRNVDRSFVTTILQESGIGTDYSKLYVPNNRRRFNELMESRSNHVDYIVFPELVEISSGGRGVGRKFALYLRVVNTRSGESVKTGFGEVEA